MANTAFLPFEKGGLGGFSEPTFEMGKLFNHGSLTETGTWCGIVENVEAVESVKVVSGFGRLERFRRFRRF